MITKMIKELKRLIQFLNNSRQQQLVPVPVTTKTVNTNIFTK